MLCPRLRVKFKDEARKESEEWYYEDGLTDYLADATIDFPAVPEEPFVGSFSGSNEGTASDLRGRPFLLPRPSPDFDQVIRIAIFDGFSF